MRKWVILLLILAIIFGVFYYLTFGYYSEGKRGGFVVKLSKRGYLLKTYEGVLNVGGIYEGGGTLNAEQWDFSVGGNNKEAIAKLEEAIKSGQRVSLTYQEKFFVFPWNGDTQYFVTDVELLDVYAPSPANPTYRPPAAPQEPQPLPPPPDTSETVVL
ncbi:hypothetical protein [Telluribacter sp. SYSU D00476]|uniref:hypothetical protein n=1 Tax=Telluribacter sp. SYSU D00476 TaxID=2811430 RepID=UPI001FF44504|nr:hypothetical protein [Telluribacter sp. SYSU D00476]